MNNLKSWTRVSAWYIGTFYWNYFIPSFFPFLFLGPRDAPRLLPPGSTLWNYSCRSSGDHMGCQVIELGLSHANQVPDPLYYFFSPYCSYFLKIQSFTSRIWLSFMTRWKMHSNIAVLYSMYKERERKKRANKMGVQKACCEKTYIFSKFTLIISFSIMSQNSGI